MPPSSPPEMVANLPSKAAPSSRGATLRENNFDLLRLLLAVGVMFNHLHELTRVQTYRGLADLSNSTVLVESFFVISGFLIFMSYEKSASLLDYFSKRFRRIYPAYFAVVAFCTIGGAFVTALPLKEYCSTDTLKYLVCNALFMPFLQPHLPGVFQDNLRHAVNGALWTLKIEVMFYFSVPILCWVMRRTRRLPVLLLLYAISLIYSETWMGFGYDVVAKQFPGQLAFFMVGAGLYYGFEKFSKNAVVWAVAAAAVFQIHHVWPLTWLLPAAIGVLTIFLACCLPPLRGVGRWGDLSYGVYIYHFPVIQTLESFDFYPRHPVGGLVLTVSLTAGLAFASWHLIEKKFLRKSSHYRQAASEPLAPVAR